MTWHKVLAQEVETVAFKGRDDFRVFWLMDVIIGSLHVREKGKGVRVRQSFDVRTSQLMLALAMEKVPLPPRSAGGLQRLKAQGG